MKIMTVLGTRPEIIRLSSVIEKLDRLADQHILVHTGQNFDPSLSDLFFDELGVRQPDHYLGARGDSFGAQIAQILSLSEPLLKSEAPDRVLILGDTNSALVAIIAKRLGIPVYHMEAGNRCFDDRVPEEVNRRIVDHCSDVLMPYTERSRANLLREGIDGNRIFVTGNPILEVIQSYETQIGNSKVLDRLKLVARKYFLVTMHRAENVDLEGRLHSLVKGLQAIAKNYDLPIICSTHPRTREVMKRFSVDDTADARIRFLPPFGLFDFIALERNALCVLSDSGTVQEECCIFKVPTVTLRDVTERPETIECGSNILSGAAPEAILRCVRTVLEQNRDWTPPHEYLAEQVSETVIKILLGYSPSPAAA